jgi:biopolymer transport protein ExbD
MLVIVWLAVTASANTVLMIEVATANEPVTYSINRQRMTIAELGVWLKQGVAALGDEEPVVIQPDSNTSFATVFALLERLGESGAKRFEIVVERTQTPGGTMKRLLAIESDQLKKIQGPSAPPAR